jgi:hypothetical protein
MFDQDENFKKMLSVITQSDILTKRYSVQLKYVVDDILENNILSEKIIESTLDKLLDCMCYDYSFGSKDFYRLNDYYSTINSNNSNNYWDICINLFSEPKEDIFSKEL